jgi:hypothetical protein
LVTVPYYLLISANYAAHGAPAMSGMWSIIGLWVLALVAFLAGLVGLSAR